MGNRNRLTPLDQSAHGRFAALSDDQVAFPVAAHLAGAASVGRSSMDLIPAIFAPVLFLNPQDFRRYWP